MVAFRFWSQYDNNVLFNMHMQVLQFTRTDVKVNGHVVLALVLGDASAKADAF